MKSYDLFVEFTQFDIKFFAIRYDETGFKDEVEKDLINFDNFHLKNLEDKNLHAIIIKKISDIENKIDFNFKYCYLLVSSRDSRIIKVSSFKQNLNNKITKNDIQFNLNALKSTLDYQEHSKKLIHIFNSKFIIDNEIVYNLPLNKFCKYFKQENIFIYLPKSLINKYYDIINKCNLSVKRVIISDYALASNLINQYSLNKKILIDISIKENNSTFSNMSYNSLTDVGHFNFGSHIIYKDIAKLCSLKDDEIKLILKRIKIDKNYTMKLKNNYSDKINSEFLLEIATARIEEIFKMILSSLKFSSINRNDLIFRIKFEDKTIKEFLENAIYKIMPKNYETTIMNEEEDDQFRSCKGGANIVQNGWESEAVPVMSENKSFLIKLLRKLFEF